MRGKVLAVTAVVAVALVGFVILDADQEGRADLWSRVTGVFQGDGEAAPQPNWGDVATRVGTFTEEERNLREVLNPTLIDATAGEAALGADGVPADALPPDQPTLPAAVAP